MPTSRVVDASALVAAVVDLDEGRDVRAVVGRSRVIVPHLADVEVVSALRRQTLSGWLEPSQGRAAIARYRRLPMVRRPVASLLPRAYELRDNLSAYDATYVALAEVVECDLVTRDRSLTKAPGIRCDVLLFD